MSSSIYNILDWANSTNYNTNDIVKSGPFYYYATQPHTSHATQSFDQVYANTSLWVGTAIDNTTGATKQEFTWKPSVNNAPLSQSPRVRSIKFGDGYEQVLQDGINLSTIKMDLMFDGRDIDEATAILHFLETMAGWQSFIYTPPKPYNTQKKFRCKSWQFNQTFYNNYSVSASFEEAFN